jgi:hypothetical protein
MNKLLEEQAKLQDAIDAAGGWELERKLEIAADALRLPPWEAKIESAIGRREAPCGACAVCCCRNPTCCYWMNLPIIWMPNRWHGSSAIWKSTRAPSWR